MYAVKVKLQGSQPAEEATPDTASPSAHAAEERDDVISFSAGNPRVEHVTGVVHLFRHVPNGPDAATPASSLPVKQCNYATCPVTSRLIALCTRRSQSLSLKQADVLKHSHTGWSRGSDMRADDASRHGRRRVLHLPRRVPAGGPGDAAGKERRQQAALPCFSAPRQRRHSCQVLPRLQQQAGNSFSSVLPYLTPSLPGNPTQGLTCGFRPAVLIPRAGRAMPAGVHQGLGDSQRRGFRACASTRR